ncbi:MAG TPA: hypothetical protein VMF51_11105, partial [Nocardioides sp.]|uniref:hypothetical protein n=1 Tax=Nocardioides sp. TaxID=35761 RepID=UPI002B524EA8
RWWVLEPVRAAVVGAARRRAGRPGGVEPVALAVVEPVGAAVVGLVPVSRSPWPSSGWRSSSRSA